MSPCWREPQAPPLRRWSLELPAAIYPVAAATVLTRYLSESLEDATVFCFNGDFGKGCWQ